MVSQTLGMSRPAQKPRILRKSPWSDFQSAFRRHFIFPPPPQEQLQLHFATTEAASTSTARR
eukprot:4950138-Pyramimonas_sp.AAC.1